MANTQSAKKRARQNEKRRAHNAALRSRLRTAIKKVLKAIQSGDKEAATQSFRAAVPEIDRMVNKGIIAKNRAAHYKSKLNARLRAM
ncbi:MAG TPA: 30S ribosomal protein S20 [Gammaproteobacteria bacterium]